MRVVLPWTLRTRGLISPAAIVPLVFLVASIPVVGPAAAQQDGRLAFAPEGATETADTLPPPAALTLISINKQRMYVYDNNGFVTTSRVSTGTLGYDTPKGIYSVIQKKVDHKSNLYEGAPMPHMQRLLWTGIALHGGAVQRGTASHGCVRLPWDFAETYFGMTALNHRVIITPEVQAPVSFSHPLLFTALPQSTTRYASTESSSDAEQGLGPYGGEESLGGMRSRAAIAAERAARKERVLEDDRLAKEELAKSREAELTAAAALVEAKAQLKLARDAFKKPRAAEVKAASNHAAAEKAWSNLSKSILRKSGRMRADELAKLEQELAALRQRADAAKLEFDAAAEAGRAAKTAMTKADEQFDSAAENATTAKERLALATNNEATALKAREDFELAERNRPKPVSVFVSSRTGLVSVRQGFEPVAEGVAEISDQDMPLSTYVFTATGWADETSSALTWTALGVNEKGEINDPRGQNSDATRLPPSTDVRRAKAALDRIRLPQHILEIIAEAVKPGSSLIISDYDMSRSEVGKGTDFIVQMPEVIAKYRTPEDIAAARAQRLYASGGYGAPWYYLPNGTVQYRVPPKYWANAKPKKYRPMRNIFAYGEPDYDDDD